MATRKVVAWARLPIQDELTLALAGRASRTLTPVKGSTGEEAKEGKEQRKPGALWKRLDLLPRVSGAEVKYVCGIDIGSQSCSGCITRPDKSMVLKPMTIALAREGWQVMEKK